MSLTNDENLRRGVNGECDNECQLCDMPNLRAMTTKVFDKIVDDRLRLTKNILSLKAGEYATSQDRLWNFRRAAKLSNNTPEQALLGMLTKHIISIYDMVDNVEANRCKDAWQEKIGDAVSYLILLEALILERLGKCLT